MSHNAANEIAGVARNHGNRLNRPGPPNAGYDASGNMTTIPQPSVLTADYAATYDAWNRVLAEIAEVEAGMTTVAVYHYDGLRRRIRADDPVNDVYRHYFHDASWRSLETRVTDTPATDPATLQPQWQYVWSVEYIDALASRDVNTDADDLCDDGRTYYLHDANMNVTTVIDDAGDAIERYRYDPYGVATILDGSTGGQTDWATDADQLSDVDNEIRFGGYVFDPVIDLYHVRNRAYAPRLGWVQRDPLGYVDGYSLYYLLGNSPMRYSDPSGLAGLSAGGCSDSAKAFYYANIYDPFYKGQLKYCLSLDTYWEDLVDGMYYAFDSIGDSIVDAIDVKVGFQDKFKQTWKCCAGGKIHDATATGKEYFLGFNAKVEIKTEYNLWGSGSGDLPPCPDAGPYFDILVGPPVLIGGALDVKAGISNPPKGFPTMIGQAKINAPSDIAFAAEFLLGSIDKDQFALNIVNAVELGVSWNYGVIRKYNVKLKNTLECCP